MSTLFIAAADLISRLNKDEKGTQLVETAIWLGIVSAAGVAAVVAMSGPVTGVLEAVRDAVQTLPQ